MMHTGLQMLIKQAMSTGQIMDALQCSIVMSQVTTMTQIFYTFDPLNTSVNQRHCLSPTDFKEP